MLQRAEPRRAVSLLRHDARNRPERLVLADDGCHLVARPFQAAGRVRAFVPSLLQFLGQWRAAQAGLAVAALRAPVVRLGVPTFAERAAHRLL